MTTTPTTNNGNHTKNGNNTDENSKKSKEEIGRDKFDTLMNKMNDVKEKWKDDSEADDPDDKTGQLLDQAIEFAIEQGRGWSPGEKEAYLEQLLDDDFVSFGCLFVWFFFSAV